MNDQRPGIVKHALVGLGNILGLIAIAPLGLALGIFVLLMGAYDIAVKKRVRRAY